MKSADVRDNTYIDFDKKKSNNILNFKLVILLEYQNKTKKFAKGYTINWSEEVSIIKKFEILFHGLILLLILMMKKLLEDFMKKFATNKSRKT